MIPSRTTTAVPASPRPLLTTSFSFQPFQIPITIIPIPYGPLEASPSLSDRLSPLQDHQLCFRSTQSNPRYSMPIAAINNITYHSRTTMNQYKTPRQQLRYSPGPPVLPNQPRTFLANPNLSSQPLQTTDVITHHFRTTTHQFAQLLYSVLLCEMDASHYAIPLMTSLPLNAFPSTSLSALIPCLILHFALHVLEECLTSLLITSTNLYVPIRHIEANFREKVAWGESWSSGVVL